MTEGESRYFEQCLNLREQVRLEKIERLRLASTLHNTQAQLEETKEQLELVKEGARFVVDTAKRMNHFPTVGTIIPYTPVPASTDVGQRLLDAAWGILGGLYIGLVIWAY